MISKSDCDFIINGEILHVFYVWLQTRRKTSAFHIVLEGLASAQRQARGIIKFGKKNIKTLFTNYMIV